MIPSHYGGIAHRFILKPPSMIVIPYLRLLVGRRFAVVSPRSLIELVRVMLFTERGIE